nr:hypothetical protein [uncultured archaeon]
MILPFVAGRRAGGRRQQSLITGVRAWIRKPYYSNGGQQERDRQ